MNSKRARLVCLLVLTCILGGCGESGPNLHSVAGKVELREQDVTLLHGSVVELSLLSDPTVRGFGEIQPDGKFQIKSLVGGELYHGVPEGRYAARILPHDEDGAARQQATKAIAPRYLKFDTSGLSVQVPVTGDFVLQVTSK